MYKLCQCIIRIPILDCTLKKKKQKTEEVVTKKQRKNIMIWKHLKNNDLIISSKMSLDAQAMKRSVLPMDSWWSATVKSWIQSAIHCIKLFDYSKNTMG